MKALRLRWTRRSLLLWFALAGVLGAMVAALRALSQEVQWYCEQVQVVDPRFRVTYLEGADLGAPTCLQFGPDDRLYVSQDDGVIQVFSVSRKPDNGYEVRDKETISLLQDIPNHDDDGRRNAIPKRLITGLLVTGAPERPVLYLSSSDPRIKNARIDTNSGVISRLTRHEQGWRRQDLVRGLPRSRSDHATNGLHLDAEHSILYAAQGSNTNAGAPSQSFGFLSEYALSAAILKIDLNRLPQQPYDLPTLDDEERPGNPDENDPFGGNGGKNQAMLTADGPVQVFAAGFRNPYDLVWRKHGFYLFDNGSNQYYGAPPRISATDGRVSNEVVEGGEFYPSALHHVARAGYYGGHPNPTRANKRNTFNETVPQSPVAFENPVEAHFLVPQLEDGALTTFAASTNGIAVYQFGGLGLEADGSLLTVSLNRTVYLIKLDSSGRRVLEQVEILKGGGAMFLDVVAQSDTDPYPGTIWIADYGTGRITVLQPQAETALTSPLSFALRSLQLGCSAFLEGRSEFRALRRKVRNRSGLQNKE